MKHIVTDNRVVLPHLSQALSFHCWGKDAAAIGQYSESKTFEAGIVFDQWQRHDVHGHIFVFPGCSLTRRFLRDAATLAFIVRDVARITVCVRASNERSLKLMAGIGFSVEGRRRAGYSDGEDMIELGMLKHECKWLKGVDDGL